MLVDIKRWMWIANDLKASTEASGSISFIDVSPPLPIEGVHIFELLYVIKLFLGRGVPLFDRSRLDKDRVGLSLHSVVVGQVDLLIFIWRTIFVVI